MVLDESSPKTRSFAFLPKRRDSNEAGRYLGHVQKGLQECLYINYCGIF